MDNVTWRVSRPYTGDNPYGDKIVWFDDVRLEEGSRVSALNMLANSGFNALLNGKPEGYMFSTGNTAVDTVVSTDHRNGQNSIKITSAGGEAFLFLHQQVILEPNTDYTVSFWIKGEGLEKTGDSICQAQGDNKSLAPSLPTPQKRTNSQEILVMTERYLYLGMGRQFQGITGDYCPKWIQNRLLKIQLFEKPFQCSFRRTVPRSNGPGR